MESHVSGTTRVNFWKMEVEDSIKQTRELEDHRYPPDPLNRTERD
jgi:hypothetical protein